MPSWKVANRSSLTNNIKSFGVMGGLSNSRVSTNTKRATNTLRIPKTAAAGLAYMKMNNLLSKNPLGSGGVGKVVKRKPCNCKGLVKKTEDAVTQEVNLGANATDLTGDAAAAGGVPLWENYICMSFNSSKQCLDASYVCISGGTTKYPLPCLNGRNFPLCAEWVPPAAVLDTTTPPINCSSDKDCGESEQCKWLTFSSGSSLYCADQSNNLHTTCNDITNLSHGVNSNNTITTLSHSIKNADEDLIELYNEWRMKYPDAKHHFENWSDSHERIKQHNESNKSWSMGHNQFSGHLTTDYFPKNSELNNEVERRRRSSNNGYNKNYYNRNAYESKATTLSNAGPIDWRDVGAVTSVKNQGNCTSCWTFSATGAIEGAYKIKYPQLPIVSLSEQNLLSCCPRAFCQNAPSCETGGLMTNAFHWLQDGNSISHGSDYRYVNQCPLGQKPPVPACNINSLSSNSSNITVERYDELSYGQTTNTDLLNLLQYGPVSIGIDAETSDMKSYTGGIIDPPYREDHALNHGVLLVGSGPNYWIIKNSWGQEWGEKGYFRLIRDDSHGLNVGALGILLLASQPYVV